MLAQLLSLAACPHPSAGRRADTEAKLTQMAPQTDFDYRTATEREIVDRAAELPVSCSATSLGRRSQPLVRNAVDRKLASRSSSSSRNPPNSRAEADFPGAGIELKSVPLIEKTVGMQVELSGPW